MIAAVLEESQRAVQHMTPRQFHSAKCRPHPAIVARLHGDGRGRLVAVRRDYKPIGCNDAFADYTDARFDSLRIDDTPEVRALAAGINLEGRSNFPGGSVVPILVVLDNGDTRESYCRRLRALIEELRP
jgi:hypothetical protein